jgi:hypothetical protein
MAKNQGAGGRRMAAVPTAPMGVSVGNKKQWNRSYKLVTSTINAMNDRNVEEMSVLSDRISEFVMRLPVRGKVANAVEAPLNAISEYLNRAYEAGKLTPRNQKSLEAQIRRYLINRNRVIHP